MRVWYLEAYDDSKLIINQVKREYEVRHEYLKPYHHAAIKLSNSFDDFNISHLSRLLNTMVDALVALMVTLALPTDTTYRLMVATRYLFHLKYGLEVRKVHTILTNFELRDWRFPIIDYTLHGVLPDDPKEATSV